jgi:hypothetical protein
VLACIVNDDPPSTINGWVNNSILTFATTGEDLIAVIPLFITITVALLCADVTRIDLIIIVSLTPGVLAGKTFNAFPVVSLSIPTNLYWFTTAIIP